MINEVIFAVTDHNRVLALRIVADEVMPCGTHKVSTVIHSKSPTETDEYMHKEYYQKLYIGEGWTFRNRCLFREFDDAKSFVVTSLEEKIEKTRRDLTFLETKQEQMNSLTLKSLLTD
nr:conserved hypothetical protein [Vibrio chagasii]